MQICLVLTHVHTSFIADCLCIFEFLFANVIPSDSGLGLGPKYPLVEGGYLGAPISYIATNEISLNLIGQMQKI